MFVVVLVTTSSAKEAEQIAQTLLEKQLAACINIVPRVHSRFWWKGKIERCDEALMIIKSKVRYLMNWLNLVEPFTHIRFPRYSLFLFRAPH